MLAFPQPDSEPPKPSITERLEALKRGTRGMPTYVAPAPSGPTWTYEDALWLATCGISVEVSQ